MNILYAPQIVLKYNRQMIYQDNWVTINFKDESFSGQSIKFCHKVIP